ncbi:MAG: hypothetical protein ACRDSH_14795 [Pseudonocardiaceae bacterium]
MSPLESPDDEEANPLCVASGAATVLAPVLTECEVRSDPVLCVAPVVAVVAGELVVAVVAGAACEALAGAECALVAEPVLAAVPGVAWPGTV